MKERADKNIKDLAIIMHLLCQSNWTYFTQDFSCVLPLHGMLTLHNFRLHLSVFVLPAVRWLTDSVDVSISVLQCEIDGKN